MKEKVKVEFNVKMKEEDGMFSCYIPIVGVYYSAPNEEEAKRRAPVMVKAFCDFHQNCHQYR